jgi:hypothetical protein
MSSWKEFYCAAVLETNPETLAWIIHDFAGEKRKGALKD